jgi:hypothetical protein
MSGIQMLLAAGGKGITYPNLVSSQTAAHGASAAITITAPTSITAGNLLVAFICQADQGTGGVFATPPSGFTLRSGTVDTGSLMVYTKTATGSEPASYTWSGAGTAKQGSGCLLNYSATAYDTSGNAKKYQSSPLVTLIPSPTSLTVANAFSIVFFLGGSEDAGSGIYTPSGYSILFESIGGTGQGGALWVFYKLQAAAGNSGSPSTTMPTSGQGYVLMSVLNGV